MSDGFNEFTFGDGDKNLGRKTKKFDPEAGKTYKMSFVWYREFNTDGTPNTAKSIRFVNCERIYKEGVGYILYKSPAYAEFGKPKTAVATIVAVWPTTRDGNVDMHAISEVEIMPWIFAPDKFETLSRMNQKFPLSEYDIEVKCTDPKFKKLDMVSDNRGMMALLRSGTKESTQTLLKSIYADVAAIAENIRRDMARDLSLDEIREKLGMDVGAPVSGSRASKDADSLLDDLV